MSCAVIVNSTFVMAIANVELLVSWNAQRCTLSNVHMLRIHIHRTCMGTTTEVYDIVGTTPVVEPMCVAHVLQGVCACVLVYTTQRGHIAFSYSDSGTGCKSEGSWLNSRRRTRAEPFESRLRISGALAPLSLCLHGILKILLCDTKEINDCCSGIIYSILFILHIA
jgi:hypothetical protein